MILEIKELTKQFEGLLALDNFSLEIKKGQICGLIGKNGSGKTTLFNLLTGIYKPDDGYIKFLGENITGEKTYKIIQKGIARTFQNVKLFNNISVLDNVLSAMHFNVGYGFIDAVFKNRLYYKEERRIRREAEELLDRFKLVEKIDFEAGNLNYIEQKKLEIVRALASKPEILLLDEPVSGVNPQESIEIMEMLKKVRDELKITIFLIENDMRFVMNICEYLTVLDYGKIIAKGTPESIKNNPKVIEAYLGGG